MCIASNVTYLAETQIPTIAHHHDFYWKRVLFTVNAVNDYISMAFPPNLPNIEHVVINSTAREELSGQTTERKQIANSGCNPQIYNATIGVISLF